MGFTSVFNRLLEERGVAARLSEHTGISTGLISNYKNGVDPSLTNAIKIADFFGVSLDYLAGKSEEKAIRYADAEVSSAAARFARLGKDGRRAVVDQIELQEFKSEKSETLPDNPASEKVG